MGKLNEGKKNVLKLFGIIVFVILASLIFSTKIYAFSNELDLSRTDLLMENVEAFKNKEGETVTIKLQDDIFYKSLIDNYGANPTGNSLEITMTKQQITNMKEYEYIGSDSKKIYNISGIENFKNLEVLKLNKNGIQDITPVKNLTDLQVLEIQSNQLKTLPDLSNLVSLYSLDISSNSSITSLKGIENNLLITKLNAGNCNISSIEHIYKLRLMEELNLSNNNINSIDGVSRLKELRILKLNNNNSITKIEEIIELSNLEELELDYNNQITDLKKLVEKNKEGDKEAKLLNLKKLHLAQVNNSNSKITINDLEPLKNLEDLDLSNNNLGKSGLNGILKLKNIKILNASSNGIVSIEPLVKLKKITEDGFTRIEVEEKSSVEELILQKNEITDVTTFAYMGSNIKYLDLRENHISYVDPLEYLTGIKDVENNLLLQKQTGNFAIKVRDIEGIEHKKILANIFQYIKDPNRKVYTSDANFTVTGDAVLNTDYFETPNGSRENYNTPGYYNIVFAANAAVDQQAQVKIKGGIANGSEFTYTIVKSTGNGVYDTIIFEDYYLAKRVAKDLSTQEIAYSYVPYIINMEYPVLKGVKSLSLAGNDKEKVRNVTGLQAFASLEILNLSINSISSDNNESDIDLLKELKNIKTLNLSDNQLSNANVITDYKSLESLDLSNNNISELKPFEEWLAMLEANKVKTIPLKNLNISNNKTIEDLRPISKITTLTNLYVSKNKISDITPIKDMEDLTVLDLSDNEIDDIQTLANFSKLDSLSIGTNYISDISSISDLSLRTLDISNNDIDNLNDLRYMRSLTSLKASKNKISTIDPIKNLNNIKNDIDMNDQKLFYGLKDSQRGTIEIELPKIFSEAKTENSLVYTDKDFRISNCSLTENGKVKVNIDELGDKIASVSIYGGNAHGTQFSIGKEVGAYITYDIKELTNRNVTATIQITGNAIVLNNGGKNTYTFTKNGTFVFEYGNDYGFAETIVAKVSWIDKDAPVITGVEEGRVYLTAVTPLATDDHLNTVELIKNGNRISTYKNGDAISENGKYTITAKDNAGNVTTVNFEIDDGKEKLEVSFKGYTIETEGKTEYVVNIQPNTTIKTFKQNIQTNGTIEIYDASNKKVTNDNNKAGTNMKVKITKGDETREFILVVRGDVNGNGVADFSDMLKINKNRLNKSKLEGAYLRAGDIDENGKADFSDMLKINKFRLGKIKEL